MGTSRSEKQFTPWPRAIILVDMNAFFASIEQKDFPALRGRPVGVTNGMQGTCIITCSYEARRYGVKTGMRLFEARRLCSDLIQRPARPERYAQISSIIMESLVNITPDIEIFSVDEAFLDITHCQKLYRDAIGVARQVKQLIWDVTQLQCSLGLSTDKTTAKYAAKLEKPDGFQVIPPGEAKHRLAKVRVTELCGIADGIGRFLAIHGVYTCGDMQKLPISVLGQRFGNLGRRIWFMCQGADPDPVRTSVAPPKSIGHGKVMPPNTIDRDIILTYLLHMTEKVCARLRRHDMEAKTFFIGLRSREFGWIAKKAKLMAASNDGKALFQLCQEFLQELWRNTPVDQVQITALDPSPAAMQQDMFINEEDYMTRNIINAVKDAINDRYGEFAISAARLLNRSQMPNVIAPAWKPSGVRKTV